jgi:hypothetical protein
MPRDTGVSTRANPAGVTGAARPAEPIRCNRPFRSVGGEWLSAGRNSRSNGERSRSENCSARVKNPCHGATVSRNWKSVSFVALDPIQCPANSRAGIYLPNHGSRAIARHTPACLATCRMPEARVPPSSAATQPTDLARIPFNRVSLGRGSAPEANGLQPPPVSRSVSRPCLARVVTPCHPCHPWRDSRWSRARSEPPVGQNTVGLPY